MFIKEIPARISIWCKLDYPNRISIRIRSFFFVKIHFIARQHSIKTVYNVDQNALFPKIRFFNFSLVILQDTKWCGNLSSRSVMCSIMGSSLHLVTTEPKTQKTPHTKLNHTIQDRISNISLRKHDYFLSKMRDIQ